MEIPTLLKQSATFNIAGGAANGCDSLVTLDLTISNAVNGTDTQTACDRTPGLMEIRTVHQTIQQHSIFQEVQQMVVILL